MNAWFGQLPVIIATAAVISIPGLPVAWALRLKGLNLLAGTIAASFAVIALTSIVSPLLGMSWGLLPVIIGTIIITLCAFLLRFFDRTQPLLAPFTWHRINRDGIAIVAAIGIAFILFAWVFLRGVGSPEAFSQNYDTVFHLNAATFIIETGNASPFGMTLVASPVNTTFYPTVWHATVALISQITAASVPVATNTLSLVVGGIVWPVAILFFSRSFLLEHRASLIAVGILSMSFIAFPFSFLFWGLLYPNLLSIALLPFALGFLHRSLQPRVDASPSNLVSTWVAFVGALGAAVLSHPSALFAALAFSVPLLIVVARTNIQSTRSIIYRSVMLSIMAVTVLSVAVLWFNTVTGDSSRNWGGTVISSGIAAASTSPLSGIRVWFFTILVIGGAVVLLGIRKHRWLLGAYAVMISLFVIVTSFTGPFRDVFTQVWYNDAYRVAALLPIVAVPLAAVSVSFLIGLIIRNSSKVDENASSRFTQLSPLLATSLILLLIVGVTRGQVAPFVTGEISVKFRVDDNSKFVTPDELALFLRLHEEIPEDSLIVANPWNGSAFIYTLSDREVLFPHLKGVFPEGAVALADSFGEDITVTCSLIDSLGVTHVVSSSNDLYRGGGPEYFKKLDDLEDSSILTELDREGGATLFEITGCP